MEQTPVQLTFVLFYSFFFFFSLSLTSHSSLTLSLSPSHLSSTCPSLPLLYKSIILSSLERGKA